jgi:beta-glucosidase-like glycosyl hydrolase
MAKLMYAFAEASVQGVPGIMAGHVMAPTLDAPGVKRSAAFSPVLIGKVLRDLWKYEGVVIADDVAVERVAKSCPAGVIPAVEALKAGCDTVLFLNPDHAKLRALCADIDRAMKDGTLDHARLVKSARRLDRWPDMLKKNTEQQSVEPESGVAAPAQ